MNAKSILPFIDVTVHAFKEMFGVELEAKSPYLMRKDTPMDWEISGVIGIAGEARGVVVLSFQEDLAVALTGRLLGKKKAGMDEDVIDTVGEVVNIIAGNAKQGLEDSRLQISLPSIVMGRNHQVVWPSSTIPIIGIPFTSLYGDFHLSVGLESLVL